MWAAYAIYFQKPQKAQLVVKKRKRIYTKYMGLYMYGYGYFWEIKMNVRGVVKLLSNNHNLWH